MSDYKILSVLENGVLRNKDLSVNTLVVGNAKIGGETNYVTFVTTAVSGAKTITMPNANIDLGNLLPKDLADGYIWIGDASGKAAGVLMSGDITITNLGATSIGSQKIINSMVSNSAAIDESKIALAYSTSDLNTAIGTKIPTSYLDTDTSLTANSDAKIATQRAVKAYVDAQVGGAIVGAVVYKGTFDASAGNFTALNNSNQGWLYKVSVAGTIGGTLFSVGDNIYINKDTVTTVLADIDLIDNTEAADLLRNSMLAPAQIFVGSALSVATPTTVSGDVQISATGVTSIGSLKVTNAMLAGNIAYGKLDLSASIVNADIAAAAGIVDSKLATIYTPDKVSGSAIQLAANSHLSDSTGLKVNLAGDNSIMDFGPGLLVMSSPQLIVPGFLNAGEALAIGSTYALRMSLTGESAGKLYKATNDASASDKFYVLGLVDCIAAGIAADAVIPKLVVSGSIAVPNTFAGADIGKPVFLDADGALTLIAPSAVNTAVCRVGIVGATGVGASSVMIGGFQVVGIN